MRHIASIAVGVAVLWSVVGCGGGSPGTTPTPDPVTLSVTAADDSIGVGGSTAVTVTATQGGNPLSGLGITWTASPPAAANLSATTGTTGSAGQATVTLTGLSPVSVTVTATASSGETGAAGVVVTSGQVLFRDRADDSYYTAPNTSSATVTAVTFPTTGATTVLGHQTGGSLLLLQEEGDPDALHWLYDLSTGAKTAFTVDGMGIGNHYSTAAITADGTRVIRVTLASSTIGSGIFVTDSAGDNSVEIFAPPTVDDSVSSVCLSPNGSQVAFTTQASQVWIVPIGGGAATQLDLDGATWPDSMAWLSETQLLVSVANADGRPGTPVVLLVTPNGSAVPAEVLSPTVAANVAVDGLGNIIYDDTVGTGIGGPRAISRRDAPTFAAGALIVQRGADSREPRYLDF